MSGVGGAPDAGAPARWSDPELVELMRRHAPPGVRAQDMLPVLRALVDGGADPRSVVAAVQAGLAGAPHPAVAADGPSGTTATSGAPGPDGPDGPPAPDGPTPTGTGPAPGRDARADRADRPRLLRRTLIVLGWLLVWEVADHLVGNRLVLTGPVRTLQALVEQAAEPEFWLIALASFGRIALGFLAAVLGGSALAALAHRYRLLRDVLSPLMSVLRTVPMVSFVIMLLIWVGGQALTVWLAFLIVVPLVYVSMTTGLSAVDPRQRELARLHRVSAWKRFWFLSRPAFLPFLVSACQIGLGMSWKAGIMAEVFATPTPSIGKEMFTAKTFLDTPALFAWTVVVMVLSLLFERLVMLALRQAARPCGALLGRRG
jgi:ABC-type nitrate/sulfonate/bicarbonate transport system permease component